jgi:hypothetical protein
MYRARSNMQTLTLDQLRSTHATGAVLGITLRAVGPSFEIEVETRGGPAVLVTTRAKEARHFADPRKALLLLRELGINEARIDSHHWRPEELQRTARADVSQKMKATHEAAAYDQWFRAKVQASLDDPRPAVSDEEAKEHFAAKRAALKASLGHKR